MSDTFDILNFSTYKIMEINPICNYSVPCIHEVSILYLDKNIKINMEGELITRYFSFHNIDIPYHFNIYISEKALLN
jgi:hypothetical protein